MLKPYDELYPIKFRKEVNKLHKLLPERVINYYHIGSTAIPGLISKPVVDIAITIEPFPLEQIEIEKIENEEYIFWYDNPDKDRMFFLKGIPRTYHLHIYPIDHQKLKDQLAFRDLLIKDEKLRMEYAKLKTSLARQFYNDRERYTEEKGEFVKKVLSIHGNPTESK